MTDPATSNSKQCCRWWPLVLICTVEACWLAFVWLGPAMQRQEQVTKTGVAIGAAFALLLLWLLALSRLPWRRRLIGAVLLLAIPAMCAALFRFEGVNGDLVPIFAPRWKAAKSSTPLFTATPSLANASAVLPESFAGFPQFLGPTRDGIIPGPALAREWKTRAPELLWRLPVGEGYSGFAIAGAFAVTLEQRGPNEAVVCRDLFTGTTFWAHEDAARFDNPLGGVGPRTTPTIVAELVFALGATGKLRCLELTSGKLLWQRDILADAKAQVPDWGVAGSPLVANGLVIVHPGGSEHSLRAYRAETGEPVWGGGDARAGYSSPQLVNLGGEPQFLIFNHEAVAGHAAGDGRLLWSHPWTRAAQHVSDPRMVAPNRFVVSSGYGAGADLVEVLRDPSGAWQTTRIWHSRRLKSKFGPLIARDDSLYGLDDGRLTCIKLATGEPRWKGERVGHGQMLLAGDLLLVTAEKGEVLLFEATPEAPRELGRFAALPGKMWNPPALAPPFLIVRTEREAACYRLPLAEAPE